jgi:hypothetical protein
MLCAAGCCCRWRDCCTQTGRSCGRWAAAQRRLAPRHAAAMQQDCCCAWQLRAAATAASARPGASVCAMLIMQPQQRARGVRIVSIARLRTHGCDCSRRASQRRAARHTTHQHAWYSDRDGCCVLTAAGHAPMQATAHTTPALGPTKRATPPCACANGHERAALLHSVTVACQCVAGLQCEAAEGLRGRRCGLPQTPARRLQAPGNKTTWTV